MNAKSIALITAALTFILSVPAAAQSSSDWVEITDPQELRALYSNKTFKGRAGDGNPFVGYYRADGNGLLIWGGQRIPRTWQVKGSQVCVTAQEVTSCFELRRHKSNRNEIIARHVTAYWISQFTVEDGVPNF